MTHLYLIRHGDYIDVEGGAYIDNPGLSPEGIRQTERLRDRLAQSGELNADALISSPLRRAHETAQILSPVLGQPVVPDDAMEEWRGDDGTLSPEEFNARWSETPITQRPFFRWVAAGETWLEFSVRVQQTLNRILQEHAEKTIVLVCHGGVIQASYEYFFGYGLATQQRVTVTVRNTSITHWFKPKDGTRWVLERHNDYHHLV
jgi:probable phosphoglycerate mutase